MKLSTNKKIAIGLGIGLTFLSLLITGIIIITTTTIIQDLLPYEKEYEFGYYQKGEIIKNKDLKIFITNTHDILIDASNPDSETYFVVGIQVKNDYYKKSLTSMPSDFILIDENGNEFKNILYSSDELYNLKDFEEILPSSNLTRLVVFELPYDPKIKYELKIENIGLICMQNCIDKENEITSVRNCHIGEIFHYIAFGSFSIKIEKFHEMCHITFEDEIEGGVVERYCEIPLEELQNFRGWETNSLPNLEGLEDYCEITKNYSIWDTMK